MAVTIPSFEAHFPSFHASQQEQVFARCVAFLNDKPTLQAAIARWQLDSCARVLCVQANQSTSGDKGILEKRSCFLASFGLLSCRCLRAASTQQQSITCASILRTCEPAYQG
eukprot:32037-Pelagomonas_calceolata.AAC.5